MILPDPGCPRLLDSGSVEVAGFQVLAVGTQGTRAFLLCRLEVAADQVSGILAQAGRSPGGPVVFPLGADPAGSPVLAPGPETLAAVLRNRS